MKKIVFMLMVLLTQLANAQEQQFNPDTDAIIKKAGQRSQVLIKLAPDSALGTVLPKQYPICLYSSFIASNDDIAHEFMLKQIDFMASSGLDSGSVRALIAYGHALVDFASSALANRQIEKVDSEDIQRSNLYAVQAFSKLKCVETFGNMSIKDAMQGAIQGIVSKP